jgi:hypothetical protein
MKKKKQCAVCGPDKKHDGKNYRRVGVGEANKRQGEFCKNGWVLFAVGRVGLWDLLQWMKEFQLFHKVT